MLNLKVASRRFIDLSYESFRQEFFLLCITLISLIAMFLSNQVLAADIVVNSENVATMPQLVQTHIGIPQIDIVKPVRGISHNRLEQYNVGADGIIINNSIFSTSVEGLGLIGDNKNLTEPAKIILLEVIGATRSKLLGKITIVGEQAKIILVNSNGIICDGSDFVNTYDVELRTDKVHSIDREIRCDKDLNGYIYIGKNGIRVRGKSLTLSSGKMKIEGAVSVKELLRAEAHFTKMPEDEELKDGDEEYVLDINTTAPITAGKVFLIATGERSNIRISTPSFLIDETIAKSRVETEIDKGYVYVEAKGGDISILDASTELDRDFKFVSNNLKNQNILKARNIELNLSEDFINNGHIQTKGNWHSTSKSFTNYQKMDIGNLFQIESKFLNNDLGGHINSGSIRAYLTGKREDGYGLYQGSNSILEARDGMELITKDGGMYFGYKKESTRTGVNKDGFVFVGSQLLSYNKPIYIQSAGNVIFNGTQTVGGIAVETKGEINENNPTVVGAYKIGVRNIKKVENKIRTVNKPVTKTRQVYDHTEKWCKTVDTWFGCPGGWGYKDHYRTESYVEDVPTEESYIHESTIQETSFQDVILKTNFSATPNAHLIALGVSYKF